MYDSSFYNKYNNFNIKIERDNPMITLQMINLIFYDHGLRVNENDIKFLENIINEMFILNEKEPNIESIINCIATIQLKQPFFDGNHRTSILFFKSIMKELVPSFNYIASQNNDEFSNFFPIYYYYDEKPAKKNIETVYKYIK